jgi:hypothetical protein
LRSLNGAKRRAATARSGRRAGTSSILDRQIPYDLIVNTYDMSTQKCVDQILGLLARPDEWTAFASGRENRP